MSILRRIFASGGNNLLDRNHPHWTEGSGVFSKSTTAGERVTPGNALTVSAYFAALRAISEDIAKMPWELFRRDDDGNKTLAMDDDRFALTNDDPNSEMGRIAFKEVMQQWGLGWGNGYAHIVRDNGANPVALWPIHPSRVEVERVFLDEAQTQSEIVYKVKISNDGMGRDRMMLIPQEDMFHLHGVGDNGITGYSVLQFGAESIGIGIATQTFKGAFFGNGTAFGRVIEHPAQLTDTARANLRNSLNKVYQGAGQGFQNLVLDEGMKLAQNNGWISPEDAQLLEESEFSITDIARWFRIPPHKIQQLLHPTFNTLEQQNQEYVNDTLGPWMERWDQEAERKLLFKDERRSMFWDHDKFTLIQGDFKTRADYYNKLIFSGVLEPNEARRRENFNVTNENGNELFMQTSMATLNQIVEGTSNGQGSNTTQPIGRPSGADSAAIIEAHKAIFVDAVSRVNNKEEKAISRAVGKKTEEEMSTFAADFFIRLQEDMINALTNPALLLDRALAEAAGVDTNDSLRVDIREFARDHSRHGMDRAMMAHGGMLAIDMIYNAEFNQRLASAAMLVITERYIDVGES
jgi:HK97 family phage portal protein